MHIMSDNIAVEVVSMKKKCRYHDTLNQKYAFTDLTDGVCPDLYHIAYPYALALLYDARFDRSGDCPGSDNSEAVEVRCPRGSVTLKLERVQTLPKPVKKAKQMAEKFSEKILNFPIDKIDYQIKLTVTSVAGSCSFKHKSGDEFQMNLWDKCIMCPATFDALYPMMCKVSNGLSDEELVACQDYEGMTYKLTTEEQDD